MIHVPYSKGMENKWRKSCFRTPTNPVRPKEYMILFFFTFDIYNLLESVVYLPLFSYFKIKHVV